MGGWQADKTRGPRARDWKWTYVAPSPWTGGMSGRGDDARLAQWMKEMSAWGQIVATKCKDLEARVSELEGERDRLASPKGGA